MQLAALKSFVIEHIYVLKTRFEEKEVSPDGIDLVKLLPEEITYLREETDYDRLET